MADNVTIKNASAATVSAATDELSDSSQSPKVSVLRGDQTTAPINPAEAVADNAGFTDGATRVTPAGYIFDEVAGTALTENDAAAARIDSKRAQVGVIEDATTRGQRAAVSSGGALKVDIPAAAAAIAKAEDVASADADVGVPAMAVRKATPANTSGADGDYEMLQMSAGRLWVDASGVTVTTKEVRSATGTQSNVASSASSVTILASNANRLGAAVYNDSTAILYLLLGSATASATVYTVQIGQGGYYEVPFNYTGQLTGIWASANGNARVTELT